MRGSDDAASSNVEPWLSNRALRRWVDAPTAKDDYRRRLAIWLLATEHLYTPDVARMPQVSTPTVWQWIRRYNATGPYCLRRAGAWWTPSWAADA